MRFSFADVKLPTSGALVVLAGKGGKLGAHAKMVNDKTGGQLKKALSKSRFSGGLGSSLEILAPNGLKASRVLIMGIGEGKAITTRKAEEIGGAACIKLLASGETNVTILVDSHAGLKGGAGRFAANIALGFRARSYRFDKYRTQESDAKKPSVKKVAVGTDEVNAARKTFRRGDAVMDGVMLTRDLVSEVPNVLYPMSYASEIRKLAKDGVKVTILKEKDLEKIGMKALLGVGQGSIRESVVAIMEWNGHPKGKSEAPIALVGKGVTFDTGGISLKPGLNMHEMKWDMGGSAIVVGTMKALAKRKAKANVIGLVGLVENMPDGNAQRPGDVVKSLSGQTIEVLNTDAEGRLVLADVLWYAQAKYKPAAMIDLATLTGAMIVSLGVDQYAGYFTNDDKIAKGLKKAGEATGDLTWHLPLSDEYDEIINSDVADVKNIGNGAAAGSITAAQFLQRFTNGVPWAHIDVAGVCWSNKSNNKWEKGATGYGVRMLDAYINDNHEA